MDIYQVDAFTAEPFGGNPAGVCLLDDARSDQWMQSVALEMNVSETAFVTRSGEGRWLRWFTPTVEVDLCGHATLATAHVLWERGEPEESLAFSTRSGVLTAQRSGGAIRLNFPADPAAPADPPTGLQAALGAAPVAVHKGRTYHVVELVDESTVRHLAPDIAAVGALDTDGVIVTAAGSGDIDFVSRFFAPRLGVDEDPATGAAHCCLAPYWATRLGRTRLRGYQASRRGGHIGVEVAGDRVLLTGQAVTVLRGELLA